MNRIKPEHYATGLDVHFFYFICFKKLKEDH
jgi:hypothetical protein